MSAIGQAIGTWLHSSTEYYLIIHYSTRGGAAAGWLKLIICLSRLDLAGGAAVQLQRFLLGKGLLKKNQQQQQHVKSSRQRRHQKTICRTTTDSTDDCG